MWKVSSDDLPTKTPPIVDSSSVATRYHFTTRIELTSSPDQVWETLARSEEWIDWWRWLRSVEVLNEGNTQGIGHRVRHEVASPLGYRLRYIGLITRAVEPVMSRFEAEGDLEGRGQFEIEETDRDSTLITFHWLVETPKTWMNLLAPVARPIFVWNHHRLMRDFARDLAAACSAKLVDVHNESLDADDEGFFKMPAFEG